LLPGTYDLEVELQLQPGAPYTFQVGELAADTTGNVLDVAGSARDHGFVVSGMVHFGGDATAVTISLVTADLEERAVDSTRVDAT
jgi:hypothetical protein